ncbi:MAG: MaoC family dehydratase [Candidatus Eremiobacteraeota bacterium]|nr:MaoC family dehydratase [Candidatus Eremiobacteraeota bacterium]
MLYFEDFIVGKRRLLGSRTITEDEMLRFAREFDPQPFHVDSQAAAASMFGGLIASGWHTCAIAMRAMCDGYLLDAASLGSPGVDEIRWLKPVRPGDTLNIYTTVVEARPSRSKPDRGVVVSETEAVGADGDVLMRMRGMGMFLRKPA